MSRATINVQKLDNVNKLSAAIATANITTAVDASDGAEFVMDAADHKYLILVHNTATSDGTVTVKAGNGIQGMADLIGTVAASSYVFLQIDSGRFKNVTGPDKGKIIITGSASTIKVGVFKLP